MSNQAHISAAIEKLERLKAESTPGLWEGSLPIDWDGVLQSSVEVSGIPITWDDHGGDVFTPADADLIVTLHRTIDAQLELLRLALKYGELDAGSGSRFIAGAVKLASAILEGDSTEEGK